MPDASTHQDDPPNLSCPKSLGMRVSEEQGRYLFRFRWFSLRPTALRFPPFQPLPVILTAFRRVVSYSLQSQLPPALYIRNQTSDAVCSEAPGSNVQGARASRRNSAAFYLGGDEMEQRSFQAIVATGPLKA